MPTRTLGWRAAEAVVLGGFAYVVGFDLTLALVVSLVVLGVNAAELAGARYGHPVVVRQLALAGALLAFAGLAVAAGAVWFLAVALPSAAWFLLDAVAHAVGADAASERDTATGVEADLSGELLRELRAGPRRPASVAADLDRSPVRVRRALDALAERGVVERASAGRYRLAERTRRPALADVPARVGARLLVPLRLL
ncbi:hypothetical protein EFA46_008110 [Halarchaeum sp. CBA1220]|uniref:hypothetical protein n=1 Tax=Halarchaeum sp. CBA1220 TaxID=1853682 RepID=UPI000F3A9286|nr:hypothetical protein [Halarchaeum sp. CBA1220]QLC34168.1 hypothetical protein EFA46_008110 [Halarchaeum sp. CBA1220]